MPSYRIGIFVTTFAALAIYVLLAAFALPNIAVGIDAAFHWLGASTIHGWGAALNADPKLVAKLADGVYGEARFALTLASLLLLFIYCFAHPRVTKLDTQWWMIKAAVTFFVIYLAIDILSLKWPGAIEGWVTASGTALGRLLFVLSKTEAGPVFISAFGSMAVVFQTLCLWLIITWIFRRK